MADFVGACRPALEAALAPGEVIEGVFAANHRQSAFKGRLVAVGVTPSRLLFQPVSRRGEPDGSVQSVTRDQVAKVKLDGAGGGWATVSAAIADHSAVSLDLRTTDGGRWRLMMMHGEGILGGLGGGEAQQEGVAALARWFAPEA